MKRRFSAIASTLVVMTLLLPAPLVRGVQIDIDYSLDTNGFFNQPGSREAMRAVCDYFETILEDELARIDPAQWTGETWTPRLFHPGTGAITNLPSRVVPANRIIVFVGGRNLGGALGLGGPAFYEASGSGADADAWFDLLQSRGQTGALTVPPTDFASWGGSISFNTATAWNFSLTNPENTRASFVSTALHEMCHLLGIGTADSWDRLISGNAFQGAASVASFGRPVPVQTDGSHWQDDGKCIFGTGHEIGNPLNVLSKTIGQFGVPAGLDQIARMDPSGCQTGPYHRVMTQLDVAGLADVGWEIATPVLEPIEPPVLAAAFDRQTGHVSLTWQAVPSLTYQVTESQTLSGWANLGSPVTGANGSFLFVDQNPPAGKNFYRLEITQSVSAPPAPVLAEKKASPQLDEGKVYTVSSMGRLVHGCGGCSPGH